MNFSRYKSLGLQFLLLNQLLLVDLYQPKEVLATDNSINQPSSEYIRKIPDNSFYILGPGDILSIEVKAEYTPALNRIFSINGEGIANLARLKRVYASGLTIGELTEILNKEYSAYVKDPDVELLLIKYRPVKIYIDGEIEQPGSYILPGSASLLPDSNPLAEPLRLGKLSTNTETKRLNSNQISSDTLNQKKETFFPTLIDAIRKSGGITSFANLTNIEVIRINNLSNGSGRLGTKVNILGALDSTDSSQNIRLYDGDRILVSRSNKPILEQISKAIKSNLNPKFIDVFIGGRVENPGLIRVNKTAVLNEAIVISGGSKFLKGPVTFMRYNPDGTLDRRRFPLKKSQSRGSYENPYLRNGDVIYVGKSLLNVTTEIVTEISAPVQSLFSSYGLYKLISD